MPNVRPCKDNICAVMVTYHPDDGLKNRIINIAKQVGRVIVVDNRSSQEKIEYISDISSSVGFDVIFNDKNLGIATALNQGVKWAKDKGFSWVLLFDQDTIVEDNMVDGLAEVFDVYPFRDRIAVIGSNYTDTYTKVKLQDGTAGEGVLWYEKKTVITSGSLIPVNIFDQIGFFRDEFFIDHVDDDFCFRAIHKGFRVVLTDKEIMQHSLGASTMHRLLWKYSGTSNHSPMRRYYMTRNHFILVKENLLKEPLWVFDTVYSRFKSIILMCLFEKDRPKKLKAIFKGFFHGLFNVNIGMMKK